MKIALLTAEPDRRPNLDGHRLYVGEKRPPHGIGFLYAVLRDHGFEVDIFDRYCGDERWPSDSFESYDLMGLYCTSVCAKDFRRVIKRSKARRIAVGGPHAHLLPETFSPKVDHIVRGEAEQIVVDLALGELSERVITPPRLSDAELDALPRFPWELFYRQHHDNYSWGFRFHDVRPVFAVNTSRGCPFSCSFCSVKKIWGRKLTTMSAERIFADLQYITALGARGVYFREDNFTAHPRRVRALCEMLIESRSELLWACETRVDTVDQELMQLMRRAGCVGFYVGVESLSQPMLDLFNKQITIDQIVTFFERANRLELFTHASLIAHHPQETEEDRRQTDALLEVIKPSCVVKNTYRENG